MSLYLFLKNCFTVVNFMCKNTLLEKKYGLVKKKKNNSKIKVDHFTVSKGLLFLNCPIYLSL